MGGGGGGVTEIEFKFDTGHIFARQTLDKTRLSFHWAILI